LLSDPILLRPLPDTAQPLNDIHSAVRPKRRPASECKHLSDGDLFEIATRARSLFDQLEGDRFARPVQRPAESDEVNSHIQKWRKLVADGDKTLFEKRLGLDGSLSRSSRRYRRRTFSIEPALSPKLDKHAGRNGAYSVRQVGSQFGGRRPLREPNAADPFEEPLTPFVEMAAQGLIKAAGDTYRLLSAQAHTVWSELF